MKIAYVSDVHMEFYHMYSLNELLSILPNPEDIDVLVIAGDFTTKNTLFKYLNDICQIYTHIVYVTGNHEYYNSDFETIHGILNELQELHSDFHWLNDSIVEIDGQRFIGGTLWFKEVSPELKYMEQNLNDFRCIKDFRNNVYERNANTVKFIQKNIKEGDILVTHHAPSNMSTQAGRRAGYDRQFDMFYYTNLTSTIERVQPAYCIHGHMHVSQNYNIDNTKVVSNPRGYIDYEVNEEFQIPAIIEV